MTARRLQLEAVLAASDEVAEGPQWLEAHFDPRRYKVLVREGLLKQAEYDMLAQQMSEFARAPGAIALMVNVLALGTREDN
ncbi:MAG: hypothetical protein SGPRY_003124 [Prymnesium sp.]